MAYRQNPTRGQSDSYSSFIDNGLISGADDGDGDGDKVKVKRRYNKKGEFIEVVKTKDDTGKKTYKKSIQGPTKITGGEGGTASIESKSDLVWERDPEQSSSTTPYKIDPIDASDDPKPEPATKPKKTYKEAYKTVDKSKYPTLKDFITASKKYPSSSSVKTPQEKGSTPLEKVTPRGILTPTYKTSTDVKLAGGLDVKSYYDEESWVKPKGKKKQKSSFSTTTGKRPQGEYSTDFSASCTKDGTCGPGLSTSGAGMFGTLSPKDRRSINKEFRREERFRRQENRKFKRSERKLERERNKNKSRGKSSGSGMQTAGMSGIEKFIRKNF